MAPWLLLILAVHRRTPSLHERKKVRDKNIADRRVEAVHCSCEWHWHYPQSYLYKWDCRKACDSRLSARQNPAKEKLARLCLLTRAPPAEKRRSSKWGCRNAAAEQQLMEGQAVPGHTKPAIVNPSVNPTSSGEASSSYTRPVTRRTRVRDVPRDMKVTRWPRLASVNTSSRTLERWPRSGMIATATCNRPSVASVVRVSPTRVAVLSAARTSWSGESMH